MQVGRFLGQLGNFGVEAFEAFFVQGDFFYRVLVGGFGGGIDQAAFHFFLQLADASIQIGVGAFDFGHGLLGRLGGVCKLVEQLSCFLGHIGIL